MRMREDEASVHFSKSTGGADSLGIAVLIAPVTGRARLLPPRRFVGGREWVDVGEPILQLIEGGRVVDVPAWLGGWFGGMLCRDDEPIEAGSPVAWIELAESG